MSIATILLITMGVVLFVAIVSISLIYYRVRKIRKKANDDFEKNKDQHNKDKEKYVNDLRNLYENNKK